MAEQRWPARESVEALGVGIKSAAQDNPAPSGVSFLRSHPRYYAELLLAAAKGEHLAAQLRGEADDPHGRFARSSQRHVSAASRPITRLCGRPLKDWWPRGQRNGRCAFWNWVRPAVD